MRFSASCRDAVNLVGGGGDGEHMHGTASAALVAVGTDGVGCECGELRFEFGAKAAVYHRPDAAVADGQRIFPLLRRTTIPKQEP